MGSNTYITGKTELTGITTITNTTETTDSSTGSFVVNGGVSIAKAMNILSFKPHYDINEIVLDLIENYEKFKDLKNPRYYNIEMFKSLQLD